MHVFSLCKGISAKKSNIEVTRYRNPKLTWAQTVFGSSILHGHGLKLTRGSIRYQYARKAGLQGISFTQIFVSAFALVPWVS
jgi:hypothetical protein